VTDDGNLILSNELQPLNALFSIKLTVDGTSMLVNEVHRKNAAAPIEVTDGGTVNVPDLPPGQQIRVFMLLSYNTPSTDV
jgi:hypothetical protein